MKLAIILAVSQYGNESRNLLGCELDSKLVHELLKATNKYGDNIYLLSGNGTTSEIKEELINIINKNKDNLIEEALFYYTGHGESRNEEFYYILSDFDKRKFRQTTISNTFLDDLLRELKSEFTVKIVDACYSGIKYVKDVDNKYDPLSIDKSTSDNPKRRFNDCFFFFSSKIDQPSAQKIDGMSYFTKSFIDSIVKAETDSIRYSYIIDYISDEFCANQIQEPRFVSEGSNTRLFCSITNQQKSSLSEIMNSILNEETNINNTKDEKVLSLTERVKLDAERYCSCPNEIEAILIQIKDFITQYKFSEQLKELFNIHVEINDDDKDNSSHEILIGSWLVANQHKYFAKVIYRKELIEDKTKKPPYLLSIDHTSLLGIKYPDKKYKYAIDGYNLTLEVFYKNIKVVFKPTLNNLSLNICKIAFVFSMVNIKLFYQFKSYALINFDQYNLDTETNNFTMETELKNETQLEKELSQILEKFEAFVMEPIERDFSVEDYN